MESQIVDAAKEATDAEILDRFVHQGDQSAFERLVARHKRLIYSVCSRMLQGRRDLVDEAVQTVLVILANKSPVLLGNPNVGGWIYRTCQYVAMNARRREEFNEKVMECLKVAASDEAPNEDDRWREAREVLDGLLMGIPSIQRDAVVLHYFEGKSLDEIGEELGVSRHTIHKRIVLALRRLRKKLEVRGMVLSMTALVAGLETEAKELPIGDWRLPIGEANDVVNNLAKQLTEEMDRAAAKTMWGWIGVGAAGLVTVGVGIALVVSHLQSVQVRSGAATVWRIESVVGGPLARRAGTIQTLKPGDAVCVGDTILTSSNQEAVVVSGGRDRILLREESELGVRNSAVGTSNGGVENGNSKPETRNLVLVKGVVVAQVKHPMWVATPHAGFETDGADFFLMIAESTNSFTRLDVTGGKATLKTGISGIRSPNVRLELTAGQAVCIGPEVESKGLPSDGLELSPRYGGVFLRSAVRVYTAGGLLLDSDVLAEPITVKSLTWDDVAGGLAASEGIVGERSGEGVRIRSDGNVRRSFLIPLVTPVGVRLFGTHRFRVLNKGNNEVASVFGWQTMEDVKNPAFQSLLSKAFVKELVPATEGAWLRVENRLQYVGNMPDGRRVFEHRTLMNGRLMEVGWRTGVGQFGLVVLLRNADVEIADIVLRSSTVTQGRP